MRMPLLSLSELEKRRITGPFIGHCQPRRVTDGGGGGGCAHGCSTRAAAGDVGRLAPVEAHYLADLDRVGRADAVGARQVLVVPAVPGGVIE